MFSWLVNTLSDPDKIDWRKEVEWNGELHRIRLSGKNFYFDPSKALEINPELDIEKRLYDSSSGIYPDIKDIPDQENTNRYMSIPLIDVLRKSNSYLKNYNSDFINYQDRGIESNIRISSLIVMAYGHLKKYEYFVSHDEELKELDPITLWDLYPNSRYNLKDIMITLYNRMQILCTFISKFVKQEPESNSNSSGKNNQRKKDPQSKKTKAQKRSERESRASKRPKTPGSDRTEKLAPPFEPFHLEWAKNILSKLISLARKRTEEKDYRKMVPFVYSNLVQVAPLKIEEYNHRLFFVHQKDVSGYYRAEAKKRDRALIEAAKDIKFKGIISLHPFLYGVADSLEFLGKLKNKPSKEDVLLIMTSGCSGDTQEFYDTINSFPGKVFIFTNYEEHSGFCGCSTFRNFGIKCNRADVKWAILETGEGM